jgi:hypothetical protein
MWSTQEYCSLFTLMKKLRQQTEVLLQSEDTPSSDAPLCQNTQHNNTNILDSALLLFNLRSSSLHKTFTLCALHIFLTISGWLPYIYAPLHAALLARRCTSMIPVATNLASAHHDEVSLHICAKCYIHYCVHIWNSKCCTRLLWLTSRMGTVRVVMCWLNIYFSTFHIYVVCLHF